MHEDEKCGSIVRLLLKYGAIQDVRNDSGLTPFYLALNKKNFEVMQELVEGGADINLQINDRQETYIHLAVIRGDPPKLIKFLLDLGADVNTPDIYGLSPIQKAVLTGGDTALLELLAENGANMSARDSNGWSLLHCAARYGRTSAVAWLLKQRVDLEARSKNGRTPLHFAAQHGQAAVVELLLNGGAKINSKDDSGWTALRLASYRGHKTVVDRILDNIEGGAMKICCEIVTVLLNFGADIDAMNDYGMTPFYFALQNNNLRLMWEFIKRGANINLPINDMKETYLHLVIGQRRPASLVKFLLDLGAYVNSSDIYGLIPIQKAALMGDTTVMEVLLDYGANIFVCDRNGYTLLHCAARLGLTNTVSWLLEREINPNSKCLNGKTALYYASLQGNKDIVKMLLEAGAELGN